MSPNDQATPRAAAARRVSLIGLTLAVGYLIVLGGAYLNGHFLTDAQGRPIANDFVNVWAAGRLTLDGNPALAYDWPLHKAAEVRAVGYDFPDYYGWHYPPTFLFVAAALAALPYLAAAIVWLLASLSLYAATLGGILGSRAGVFLALGFPAALWNVTAGQNGFLTATLVGGTLGFLERRPALAGVFLGLLTYKPQFGLLFPIVLIADRRWRTIAIAAAVAVAMAVLSWLAFGTSSWAAFLHGLPVTSRVVLGEGAADWYRLQSLFGLMRAHGAGESLAWIVQAIGALALAVALVALWRSRAAFELKAAGLAAGSLLATPYLYMYDLVVLAVAVAFLLRYALPRGVSASTAAALGAAGALILIYPYVKTQVGLAAVLIVLVLVAQCALFEPRLIPREP
jgi:arabinofuranan 3-O-arabinosyltransferase